MASSCRNPRRIIAAFVVPFLLLAATSPALSASVLANSTLRPGEELLKYRRIRAHLKRLNKPSLKTIKSPDGDLIDCVPSHLQPAFDHPKLKGQKPLDPPERPKGYFRTATVDGTFQAWTLAGESCPEGTVPIRRTTEEDVLRASSIGRFGRKPAGKVRRDSTSTGHEHAVGYVLGDQYFGAKASLNVWEPRVISPSEFSLSQIWVISGSFGNDLNTIEAGWQISPQLYGDNNPRFFTYWTSDAYQETGCYNLLCSGFVQTNNKIAIGAAISPKSSFKGGQFDISLLIWKNAGILEPYELAKASHEKEKSAYDAATVAEVDRTVKKYADNLLHALEGVSSRLTELESRAHQLESSVDGLKMMIGNNNGTTDGKLRQLENVLREVRTGVQVLRDKQEIVEAQLQLAKLQASKGDNQPPEISNTGQSDALQQQIPPPQQPIQQPHQHAVPPSQPTMLPAPNAPPPPLPQQNPTAQFPGQLPQSQIPSVPSLPREPYFPSPAQQSEVPHQQYQVPVQQTQPPPPYQPSTQLPQYSQLPQAPQPVNPSPQLQPPLPQHPEESAAYMPPPQTYPASLRQPPPFTQPPSGPPPNQYYGPNPTVYEPPTSRPGSGQLPFSAGYGPPSFPDSYGSPSHPSGSAMKPSPFASPPTSSGGSSGYPRLPTAQILPQAVPTGSSSGSSSGKNRLPIDDVVEKVATMGFSRDQVRATVRKLTENGQSVDLNVVLDKLMNDGEIQPQKGWFGR